MSSFVIWLPPHDGRRVKILFSFVIFAFAGSGCHGVVSSRYGTLEVFFFWTAPMAQLVSLPSSRLWAKPTMVCSPCRVSAVPAFAPQSRSHAPGDDDAAATLHDARSVLGSCTFNTAAGAREHASTGSQTLQTFHMETFERMRLVSGPGRCEAQARERRERLGR